MATPTRIYVVRPASKDAAAAAPRHPERDNIPRVRFNAQFGL